MDRASIVRAIRRPSSAGVAGLLFGAMLCAVILLFHNAAPTEIDEAGGWVDDPSRRAAIELALGLIPFAGIAFLWFIAVIRAQLGSREDRFFETVFLGSGLLFVAMLFAAAAALKGIVVLIDAGVALPSQTVAFGWTFSAALLGSFGARMAAVFMVSVTSMGVRIGSVPRWLAIPGYLIAVLLFLTPPLPNLTQFLFPLWVALASVHILTGRGAVDAGPGDQRDP